MKIAAKAMRAALIASIVVIATCAAHRASCQSGPSSPAASSLEQPDNYTWLEEIHGAKPMAWVNAENSKTEAWLNSDPNFAVQHIRLDQDDLVKEVEANGFRLVSKRDLVPKSQYIAVFEKK